MRIRPRALAAATVVLIAAAVAGGSLTRIPEASVGVRGDRTMGPGWHARAPYARVTVVPISGSVTVDDLALPTREGSRLVFRVDLTYALGSRLGPALSADVQAGGMTGAVASLARRVLDEAVTRAAADDLLSSPSLLEAPMQAALESSGVNVTRLSFRSPMGDELTRRRETEQVQARTRAPLGRILVIGWDGADWESIRPLVAAGQMPHLARLLADGAYGDLRSYDPMFSPLLWTTVATGKAPTEHGIADFTVKDVRSDSRRMITSDFRKVKALWSVFSDFGRPSAWLAWWASYPAEPIDGVIVSDVLSSTLLARGVDPAVEMSNVATPPEFLEKRKHLLTPRTSITRADVERFFPVSEEQWSAALDELSRPRSKEPRKRGEEDEQNPAAFVVRVLVQARTYHALAKDLVRSGTPFVAVYYEAIDMMGHRFQHFRPPKMQMVKPEDYDRFRDAVSRWYVYQDELLGDLLAETSRDTIVVLVSDHGFLTGDKRLEGVLPYTSVQPAEWHRDWGIVALHGPGIRPGRMEPASIYDIAPTLLYLEGLPLAVDMPGRLLSSALTPETLRRSPPASIRSYELAGSRMTHQAAGAVDPAAMEEMMANLRALGYVGGEPADAPAPAASPEGHEATAAAGDVDTQVYYHRNLAVSYIKQGRFREAESELLAANRRKPLGKTFSMLSEVRASQGRFKDAATTLEEGWKATPDSMEPSSLLWIVDLHLLDKNSAEAQKASERWAGKMSPGVKAAVDGRLAEARGDLDRAADLYRSALGQAPLIVSVTRRLYDLELRAGRPSSLEPFLMTTLRSSPNVDAYWDLAGQIAMAGGDASTALERFQKARSLQPENGLYLGHVASASASLGHTDEAREALTWAERFPPRDGEAWMAIGSAWDRLGETERSLQAFRSAKESGLTGPGADIGAALALARAGRTREAQGVLADVARRFPDRRAVRELQDRLR